MHRLGTYLTLCAVLGCGGGSAGPSTPPPPPPPPAGLPPLQGAVSIGDGADGYGPAFLPPTVTIRRTGTVTWTNNTGVAHTVTFGQVNGAPTNIPSPAAGANSRTFAVLGEFNYACSVHPAMTGKVVVE